MVLAVRRAETIQVNRYGLGTRLLSPLVAAQLKYCEVNNLPQPGVVFGPGAAPKHILEAMNGHLYDLNHIVDIVA